jgi:hypothetical protein
MALITCLYMTASCKRFVGFNHYSNNKTQLYYSKKKKKKKNTYSLNHRRSLHKNVYFAKEMTSDRRVKYKNRSFIWKRFDKHLKVKNHSRTVKLRKFIFKCTRKSHLQHLCNGLSRVPDKQPTCLHRNSSKISWQFFSLISFTETPIKFKLLTMSTVV